jgi:hypothetical protein
LGLERGDLVHVIFCRFVQVAQTERFTQLDQLLIALGLGDRKKAPVVCFVIHRGSSSDCIAFRWLARALIAQATAGSARNRATAEMDLRRTRSDLCWPALALLSLPSPHPRGRTPTAIPPVCLNARRSTTRQRPFRPGVIILLRVKLMALALRPVSAQTALVTITASGAIRGRNHCARRARLRPPSKRKTCLMSAQTALVTITASGSIRGRNHAKSAPVRSPAGSGRPFRARRRRRGRPRASVGLAGGVL